MDYSVLTPEERQFICEKLHRNLVLIYFESQKQYQHLYKRFKKSATQLPAFLCNNWEKQSVQDAVKVQVTEWLNQIHDCQKQKMRLDDSSESAALISIFKDSVFYQMPSLYFKLLDTPYSEQYVELFCHALLLEKELASVEPQQSLSLPPEDTTALHSKIDALVLQLDDLNGKLKASNDTIATQAQAYEVQIAELSQQKESTEQTLSSVKSDLSTANKSIEQLQEQLASANARLDSYQLPQADPNQYPYRSLCMVDYSSSSIPPLIRLADVTNSTLSSVFINEEEERRFENRDRLFLSNAVSYENGFVGVWDWNATAKQSDPSNDYVQTAYNANISPVELIDISNCFHLQQLIKALQSGVSVLPCTNQALFSISVAAGQREGVLCTRKDLEFTDNGVKLTDKVFSLPIYHFSRQDYFPVRGKKFYRSLVLPSSENRIQVIEPLDIIKTAFYNKMTRNAAKEANIRLADRTTFRSFLERLETEDFYQEIANACCCDMEQAKQYISQFVTSADSHIQRTDTVSEILTDLVKNNADLSTYCKQLVHDEWYTAHTVKLEQAQQTLDAFEGQLNQKQAEYNALEQACAEKNRLIEALTNTMTQREALAQEVEDKVAARIAAAKQNASDFICEMAFHSPAQAPVVLSAVTPPSVPQLTTFVQSNITIDEAQSIDNYSDLIHALSDNLTECGVADAFCDALATYLYSCYLHKTPVLLSGIGGQEIADAFSVTLYGKSSTSLDCSLCDYRSALAEVKNLDIIAVKNPFTSGWSEHIPEIASLPLTTNQFVFLLHPFTEDILIEPKSIFSYMMPVFTELLIDDVPTNCYVGGKQSAAFSHYSCSKKAKRLHSAVSTCIKAFCLSPLTKKRIQGILTDAHSIAELSIDKDATPDVLFGLAPYAYITNKQDKLLELLDASTNKLPISSSTREAVKTFLGADT